MVSHSESKILPYSAGHMYAIVADVEKYPEFLPWCVGVRVLSRERLEDRDALRAEMLVGFGAFRERYTSRVMLDATAYAIDVSQTEGPFRRLDTSWHFTPEGEGCRVDFSIDFEFKNPLLDAVAGNAFAHVLMKMTDAFEARAHTLSKNLS